MAYGTADSTTIATSAKFIPKMWSNEVAATYEGKTVMANLVKKISFKGKKGDTIYIPVPGRSEASVKVSNAAVNSIANTATDISLVVNKHYEYSKLYEDMAELQALGSMRSFYTEDAGYALAKRVDRELHKLAFGFNGGGLTDVLLGREMYIGGDGTTKFATAVTTGGNATALTDAGLRRMIQRLEDNDADVSALVIPPVEARTLRGISRFTEQAFIGNGETIKTGRIGNLYGVEVFVSSQCPWLHVDQADAAADAAKPVIVNFSGTDLSGATVAAGPTTNNEFADGEVMAAGVVKFRTGLLLSRDCMVLGMQQDIRTQAQYKQEYLGTLVTSDTIFGATEVRDYAAVGFVVPS